MPAFCRVNGPGRLCNPCDAQTYIVCPEDEAQSDARLARCPPGEFASVLCVLHNVFAQPLPPAQQQLRVRCAARSSPKPNLPRCPAATKNTPPESNKGHVWDPADVKCAAAARAKAACVAGVDVIVPSGVAGAARMNDAADGDGELASGRAPAGAGAPGAVVLEAGGGPLFGELGAGGGLLSGLAAALLEAAGAPLPAGAGGDAAAAGGDVGAAGGSLRMMMVLGDAPVAAASAQSRKGGGGGDAFDEPTAVMRIVSAPAPPSAGGAGAVEELEREMKLAAMIAQQ